MKGTETIHTLSGYVSYKIVGDKGSLIKLAMPAHVWAFNFGNTGSVELRDLTVVGTPSGADAAGFMLAYYTDQVLISGCKFYGVFTQGPLFQFGNVDAVIENTILGGTGSNSGVIRGDAHGFRSLTVRNTSFIDYGNFNGHYYSKFGFPPAWIDVEADAVQALPTDLVNAMWGGTVIIDNVRFDEGAANAIRVKNARNVQIRNIAVNVNGTSIGAGVLLDNVKYGVVESSVFGFTTYPRHALVARNGSTVEASKLDFGAGVVFGSHDASSRFIISDPCDGCTPIKQ